MSAVSAGPATSLLSVTVRRDGDGSVLAPGCISVSRRASGSVTRPLACYVCYEPCICDGPAAAISTRAMVRSAMVSLSTVLLVGSGHADVSPELILGSIIIGVMTTLGSDVSLDSSKPHC